MLAPPAALAGTLSVDGGVLRFTDDPGLSSSVVIWRQLVDGQMRYVGRSTHIEAVRPGPGCTLLPGTGTIGAPPWSMCPVEGVTSAVIAAGDGDDQIGVGGDPATGRFPVAVQIDLGPGNDSANVATEHTPATVSGGDGNDTMSYGYGVSAVTFHGDAGDDQLATPDTQSPGHEPLRPPDTIAFDGGPGGDRVSLEGYPGSAELDGGDGGDDLEVLGASGHVALNGGVGDDVLTAFAISGSAALDAGAGNDRLRLNRSDIEEPNVRGGHTIARGGPGDDSFEDARDGDRDEIDCGAGADTFTFILQGEHEPPKEDSYTRDCPPFGTRIAATGTLSGSALRVTVTAREPLRLVIAAGDRRRQLAKGSARLRRGTNHVRVRLSALGVRQLRGKRTFQLIVLGRASRNGPDVDAPLKVVTFTRG